jgi:ATP-dependent Clp protease ATP-binding subunit ClpB
MADCAAEPAAAAGGTTARMFASVADAIHPPVAPRCVRKRKQWKRVNANALLLCSARFVAGGLRAESLTAAAAPIGPAPRAALAESARARLRSASAAPPVASSNVGFRLLTKAGWKEGTGLGAKAQGPLEPVAAFQKTNRAGVGGESDKTLQVVGAPERPPPPPRPKPPPQKEAAAAGSPPRTEKEISQEQARGHCFYASAFRAHRVLMLPDSHSWRLSCASARATRPSSAGCTAISLTWGRRARALTPTR